MDVRSFRFTFQSAFKHLLGRYVFTAVADEEKDAKQQISAQYRILAGQ